MPARQPMRLGTRARLLMKGLRYLPLLPYASIDGWLSVDEAIALYELSRGLPHEAPLCVEIGSWKGKSSVCLARGLVGKFQPRLHCIDPFDGSGNEVDCAGSEPAEPLGSQLREMFESNLRRAGVREVVEVHQGRSHEIAQGWRRPIDLLFLDGDPSHPAVRQDYEEWATAVRPGGFLVMHDVVHPVHEGPRRVVQELVTADPAWVEARYIDSMFVARRAMR